MRFKVCGDLDAPDWLLAESALLAKVDAHDVTSLVQDCVQNIVETEDKTEDWAKWVDRMHGIDSKSDLKALVATLNYIIINAAKYDLSVSVLNNELSQLGLSSDVCNAIITVLGKNLEAIRDTLEKDSLRLTRLDTSEKIDWRINCTLQSKYGINDGSAISQTAEFRIPILDHTKSTEGPVKRDVKFEIDQDKLRLLTSELKYAYNLMSKNLNV